MRSMTGFATQTATLVCNKNKVSTTVSIKSVNTRFFECICKMPYALLNLETDIIKQLKLRLLRGNVFVAISVADQSVFKGSITASMGTAQSYIDAAAHIQQQTSIPGTFTIADLIALPHIFNAEEQLLDSSIKRDLMDLVQATCTLLIEELENEGNVLQDDLRKRIQIMEHNVMRIEGIHAAFMLRRKQEAVQEIQSYETGSEQALEARKSSLYHMLDKIDIHEEIVRFKNHLVNFGQLIMSSDLELGKRLDFTLQELGREVNTIAAKCSDADIATLAIDIKVEIEKAREQVQNIV
jgi:uncharacterized protein (TIGR00255 family)